MRRGITPVIAIALLMGMTVAASGGAYAWITTTTQHAQEDASESLATSLAVRAISCGGGHAKLTLKNTGDTAVTASDVTGFLYEGDTLLNDTDRDLSGMAFTSPNGLDTVFLNFSTGQQATTGYTVELDFTDASVSADCTTQSQRSCSAFQSAGLNTTGYYYVDGDGNGGKDPVKVWCDMATDGGGWTIKTFQGDESYTGVPEADSGGDDFSSFCAGENLEFAGRGVEDPDAWLAQKRHLWNTDHWLKQQGWPNGGPQLYMPLWKYGDVGTVYTIWDQTVATLPTNRDGDYCDAGAGQRPCGYWHNDGWANSDLSITPDPEDWNVESADATSWWSCMYR